MSILRNSWWVRLALPDIDRRSCPGSQRFGIVLGALQSTLIVNLALLALQSVRQDGRLEMAIILPNVSVSGSMGLNRRIVPCFSSLL